jgi:hypothetical protein
VFGWHEHLAACRTLHTLEVNALNLRWRDHMLTLRADRLEAGENLLAVDLISWHCFRNSNPAWKLYRFVITSKRQHSKLELRVLNYVLPVALPFSPDSNS